MASTVANLASVLKDAWTSDRLAVQFYNKAPLLDWFNQTSPTMIGAQAQVPIHKGLPGGDTSTGPAGGVLNPASNQQVDQALYTMVYLWRQIALETAALNQTGSNAQSIVNAKDFEIQGAMDAMGRNASRMLANNGDGLIAQCTTTTTSNTILLLPQASGGLGYDMIVRGGLYVGQLIDIGTTADTDAIATGVTITGVTKSATAPAIVVSGGTLSTTSSHYISVANPNSATAANPELNGLRNMIGSATSILGGINPATAGNEYWAPSTVDASTTSFSLDLMLNLNMGVYMQTGSAQTTVLMSAKQMMNFYSLLQNQVRFTGERGMGAGGIGNMDGMTWNGMGVNVMLDIVDKEIYFTNRDNFEKIVGNFKKPTWTSEIEGGGQGLRWAQGTTGFVEGVVFPLQVGMNRRNASAAATNLVA